MSTIKYDFNRINAINDWVLVKEMNFENRVTSGGIVLRSDNRKSEGVRPRWARVWKVGPKQTDVKEGQWILVEHGRWTRGIELEDENTGETIEARRVENKAIIVISDEVQSDDNVGLSGTQSSYDFDFSKPMFDY